MNAYNHLPQGFRLGERYHILSFMGTGHSSVVYRAMDTVTRSEIAIKVLDPFLAQDPIYVERFRREVQVIGQLKHPNIIKIYDIFFTGEFHVICMESASGLDGKAYLKIYGPLSLNQFLSVSSQILDALLLCHEKGIVHRDIKPQNIVIDNDLRVKLLDFGISKMNTMSDLTRTGTAIGTPEYMAPELFMGNRHSDPRSDIYSLGAVFYELLVGRPCFQADSLGTLLKLHRAKERKRISELKPGIPEWLDSVISECLENDPESRYQTIYEIVSDLKKGKSAHAHISRGSESSICMNCKTEMISGLTFCHQCGTFAHSGFEKGGYSLILYDCEEKEELAEFLGRSYHTSQKAVLERLRNLPLVLADNINEQTAKRLAGNISLFPCKLSAVKNLPSCFRLPDHYIWISMIPLSLMFSVFFVPSLNNSFFSISLIILLSDMIFIYWLYSQKLRPCLRINPENKSDISDKQSDEIRFAAILKKISHGKYKTILGHILVKYLRIKEKNAGSQEYDPKTEYLDEAIDAAFKIVNHIEELDRYLTATSLSELKEKHDTLSMRIECSQNVEEIDRWIRMKSRLQSDMMRYHEIEDRYSQMYTRVVQLNGFLKKIEDAAGDDDMKAMFEKILHDLTI